MDNDLKRLIKKHVKIQESEIRKYVSEYDPLSIGEGFPEDEYDDLVHRIISILNRKEFKLDDKRELIKNEILGYSDLSIKDKNDSLSTVEKIMGWWRNQDFKTNTEIGE